MKHIHFDPCITPAPENDQTLQKIIGCAIVSSGGQSQGMTRQGMTGQIDLATGHDGVHKFSACGGLWWHDGTGHDGADLLGDRA